VFTLQDYEAACNEHRGVIVLHRGQLPRSGFQQDLEQGGYSREDLTKPVTACIVRELRDYLKEQGLDIVSLDILSGDLEVESDFFGIKIQSPLKFSYFTKSRWDKVKLGECRNPIENGDREFSDVVSDPNQMALFRA
jgi:hypothetical protein